MPPLAPQLSGLASMAAAELAPVWTLPPSEIEVALNDVLPATVDTYATAASTVAANWYDNERERAAIQGYFQAIVEPLGDLGAYALAGWATEPLRAEVPDLAAVKYRTEAGLAKRITNSGNGTVTDSAVADPQARGWIRVASADACDFCRMIAARGAVYSKSTARFASHDDCNCSARPAWGGQAVKVEKYRPSQRYLGMSPEKAAKEREKLNRQAREWIKNNLDEPAPARILPAAAPISRTAGMAQVRAAGTAASAQRARLAAWLDAEDEHEHSVQYWRQVDEDNLHSVPPSIADNGEDVPPVVETPMDKAVRELEEAVDSGDDARVERAAIALEKLERQEQQAAAREARKAAEKAAESDRILDLIEDGWDPAEAESQITGKTVEAIRRRDFIAQARAEGHVGAGFDELLTSVHQYRVDELAIEAENATRGQMVKPRYMLQVSAKQLWLVNDATARKWMSEEMAEWFDANGRLTRSQMREMILSGDYARRVNRTDYLQ